MKARAVTTALLVVVAALAVAGPATGTGSTGAVAPEAASLAPTSTAANNSTMGGQVSTFMQSSAGETDESVESGMWDAAFENATDAAKADVVDRRIEDVRQRLRSLERRKQDLQAARANGTISEAAYRAKMSQIVGEMTALNRSIERTDEQARTTGANRSAVAELRELASSVADSEMAAIAADVGSRSDLPGHAGEGGPPGDGNQAGDCPPDETATPDCSDGGGNSGGSPPDGGGPPDDDGPPNDGGPPDEGTPDDANGDVR